MAFLRRRDGGGGEGQPPEGAQPPAEQPTEVQPSAPEEQPHTVTLAQVVRLLVLARSLPPKDYEVHFAAAHFDDLIFAKAMLEEAHMNNVKVVATTKGSDVIDFAWTLAPVADFATVAEPILNGSALRALVKVTLTFLPSPSGVITVRDVWPASDLDVCMSASDGLAAQAPTQ